MYSPFLSVTGAISCSRYNQGCNGGYPFLVAKQGHEFGFYEVFNYYQYNFFRNSANRTQIPAKPVTRSVIL
jgi:hypothetical protein